MGDSSKHTPGPWAWMGQGGHNLYLATTHSGRRYVMGFRRLGLQGAQPLFQINSRLEPASELLKFEVGDPGVTGITRAKADPSVYRYDVRGIASPDAQLIATSPDLLEALKGLVAVRPANWDDEEDPAQLIAWRAADAAIAKAEGKA